MSRINVDALVSLLQSLKPGVSEVSCHPGHLRTRPDAVYNREREEELRTLTDEQVKTVIAEEGIRLINYRDYARLVLHGRSPVGDTRSRPASSNGRAARKPTRSTLRCVGLG
jgi:hypothetical protein